MEKKYPIYVPFEYINEDLMEHGDVITWCNENLSESSSNALFLSLDDIYILQYNSEVLDIINEENGGMLQAGEDDWILSTEVKLRIFKRLKKYAETIEDGREKDILEGLLRLLDISIRTKKNIYFIF
ncbi:MAG TPA: hypothetical protein VFS25_12220 [Chitinophaga sp.]|uniref:hypothetical protein n=1 Tax=Chitinophaga sp. TaxID=1869181 RepID=UPI002DBD4970|nr:hypothetical protein [Chitinophaga sp.]HEU4553600.1 hypothetical protein [Chitinophaga sp.]